MRTMCHLHRWMVIASGLMWSWVASSFTGAQPPEIIALQPAAVIPGQTTDVTIIGKHLDGAAQLWTGLPLVAELATEIAENGQEAGRVTYRISVPAEFPASYCPVRLATGRGTSPVKLLMVDDLLTAKEEADNKSLATAQQITPPIAIDGTYEAETRDYYRITATAGQRLTVEVVARRLGSPLDPLVRLLNDQGRELAYSDDTPGIAPDCRLQYTFEEAGDYYLEVRDITYQGGGQHRYRLRVGDFPLATATFPLAVQHRTTPLLVAAQQLVPRGQELLVPRVQYMPIPPDGGLVAMNYPSGSGAVAAEVIVSDTVENLELEPNDTPETASPVVLPGGINGRFATPADRDYYSFTATAGQRLTFAGETRSLASSADLKLRILGPEGNVLAEVDDTGTEEGTVTVTFPSDGTYRLLAEDLHQRGNASLVYHIAVKPFSPGFTLTSEVATANAPHKGVLALKVNAARQEYDGPITLRLDGLGDGLSYAGQIIPEKQNETTMLVTLPATCTPGEVRPVQVVGTATIGDVTFEASASSLAPLRAELSGLTYPPRQLTHRVAIGVGAEFPQYFKLLVDETTIRFPQVLGQQTFIVKAERLHGFDDQIQLAVEDLSPGFRAEVKPIEKGQPQAEIMLHGPPGAALGTKTFKVIGRATFQHQPQTITLADLQLQTVAPLAVSLTFMEPLQPGGTHTAQLSVQRLGGEPQPVTITLKGLPEGVSVEDEIMLPADANELTFSLTASDTTPNQSAIVYAEARTELAGRQVLIESPPAVLIIGPAAN